MIPAQTFRIIVAFHGAVWPLFFIGAAVWLFYTWYGLRSGRLLVASFVRMTQILLLMTGLISLYMYQFMAFYVVKGIIALFMIVLFEITRVSLKKKDYRNILSYGLLLLFSAVIVWIMGVYGR
ncbi:hypothetical protein JCM19046_4389 [Bacillus sp. JCM 19046]|nr:hypothetical protein JCM19045_2578 [Bacillus sp. JCM 19045]GAF19718.1 hypothetical protein JCM19046_4389 [Bacillus sp. JCM 19046]